MPTPNVTAPTQAATPQATAPTTQQAQATAQQTPQAPAKPSTNEKTYKLKVDGVEQSVTESELIALAQKGKSADKRFNEASQAKKQAIELVEYLKANPKEAFKKLGIDVRKFSEDTLLELINQEKMSPAERKAQEMEAKLRQYEDQEKQMKEKQRKDEMDKLVKQQHDNFEKTFMEALTASGLPKTAFTLKRMAELTIAATKKGLDVPAEQLAKLVREDYEAEHRALYANVDGETLLNLLGKEGVKKLSKAQLAKIKTGQTPAKSNPAPKPSTKAPEVDEWRAIKKANRAKLFYK